MRVCHLWKLSKDAVCPLCDQHDETWNHLFSCKNMHLQRVRQEHFRKLKTELSKLQTNTKLQQQILHIVNAWTTDTTIQPPDESTSFPTVHLLRAHNEQSNIGIHCFFRGIISKHWGDIQEMDYDRKKCLQTSIASVGRKN